MNDDGLKLVSYFGERDRSGGRFLADVLLDIYGQHGFQASALLRGAEGFGVHHRLQTQRLLTLSEDLPLVAVAVDTRVRIEAALPEVSAVTPRGLITLERARILTGRAGPAVLGDAAEQESRLTVYVGRHERAQGRPAFLAVVDLLHRHGIAGATCLLGVDGTAHGVRRRARFFGANRAVPVMVIAVGHANRIGAAIPELRSLLERPLMTLERTRVCKRDGVRLAGPGHLPETDPCGLVTWQKLMVFAGEHARHQGRPLYSSLIHRLRAERAAGATALRGFWGYHGDHAPRGDRIWALRRTVPMVTVIVDTTANIQRWFEIVDAFTTETGLVTSDVVPAARAAGRGLTERETSESLW